MNYEIKPGNELRGFQVRLYPTQDQVEKLRILQDDCRTAWNWMVKQIEETLEANKAYAVRLGLIEPISAAPNYDGMQPEEAKAAKKSYEEVCRTRAGKAYEATKKLPGCEFRNIIEGDQKPGSLNAQYQCKNGYQVITKVIEWKYARLEEERGEKIERVIKPCAFLLQSLVKTFRSYKAGDRRKKFKKPFETMPLQLRSGDCFKLGDFGMRGEKNHANHNGKHFYDCQVFFNGLKIRGRLQGRKPWGRILEGVSITEEADGWYASIKQEVPIKLVPQVIPGTVAGIDVGLDNIAAISEIRIVDKPEEKTFEKQGAVLPGSKSIIIQNKRDGKFSNKIGELQRQAAELRKVKDYTAADKKQNQANRLHLAARRHLKHQIINEVLKPLEQVETIKIEKLNSKIGFLAGSKKISVMRLIASMAKEKFGKKTTLPEDAGDVLQANRIAEVPAPYTSQDCSNCGERSKEGFSYEHGRIGKCEHCFYEQDRDVNGARVIAAKTPCEQPSDAKSIESTRDDEEDKEVKQIETISKPRKKRAKTTKSLDEDTAREASANTV